MAVSVRGSVAVCDIDGPGMFCTRTAVAPGRHQHARTHARERMHAQSAQRGSSSVVMRSTSKDRGCLLLSVHVYPLCPLAPHAGSFRPVSGVQLQSPCLEIMYGQSQHQQQRSCKRFIAGWQIAAAHVTQQQEHTYSNEALAVHVEPIRHMACEEGPNLPFRRIL